MVMLTFVVIDNAANQWATFILLNLPEFYSILTDNLNLLGI